MPRSRNPEKYDPLYMDLLEAVCAGRIIDLPMDAKEGKSFATKFYAFITSVGAALARDCKGVEPWLAARLRARHADYGQVAVMQMPGGVRCMLKALTPQSQRIRIALQQAILKDERATPSEELTELHAQEMMKKYGAQVEPYLLRERDGEPAARRDGSTEPSEKAPAKEGFKLGKPNPYY